MAAAFFGNSGAEANEGMIKLARKYSFEKYGQGRAAIITLRNSFHGRTITTLKATGQDHGISAEGAPMVSSPQHVPALFVDHKASEGQPASDPFGKGQTITTLKATGQDHFHDFFFPFTEGFRYAEANIRDQSPPGFFHRFAGRIFRPEPL